MVKYRNKLITKLQNVTKSGRRPRTSPGLVETGKLIFQELKLISCDWNRLDK